jgi:hypothetical protein
MIEFLHEDADGIPDWNARALHHGSQCRNPTLTGGRPLDYFFVIGPLAAGAGEQDAP